MKFPQSSRADNMNGLGKSMGLPRGEETLFTPDEPDVVDGGGVVDGLEVGGLASGRRVRRVVWCFLFFCSHPAYYRTACLLPWPVVASPIAWAWLPAA